MNPLSIIKEGVAGLVTSIGGILDNLTTTDAEKLEAKRKLAELQANLLIRLAEVDAEWAKVQSEVIKAETNSESWLARSWRPVLMLTFTYVIAHQFIFVPIFSLPSVLIPTDMWELLKIGMGGYVIGRTVEKTAPDIIAAIKK